MQPVGVRSPKSTSAVSLPPPESRPSSRLGPAPFDFVTIANEHPGPRVSSAKTSPRSVYTISSTPDQSPTALFATGSHFFEGAFIGEPKILISCLADPGTPFEGSLAAYSQTATLLDAVKRILQSAGRPNDYQRLDIWADDRAGLSEHARQSYVVEGRRLPRNAPPGEWENLLNIMNAAIRIPYNLSVQIIF